MGKLTRDFYCRDTLTVAQALVGKYLVRVTEGDVLAGRITETEAYIGPIDKACHAYGGRRTSRTETLFAPPGTAYVYLIYGMYHCLNFVTEGEGVPCAVLLRGVEAVRGAERMAQNRFGRAISDLTPYQCRQFLNGPGKVCKAFDVTRAQNGLDLTGETLFLWDAEEPDPDIKTGTRIGINYAEEAAAFPWRFYV